MSWNLFLPWNKIEELHRVINKSQKIGFVEIWAQPSRMQSSLLRLRKYLMLASPSFSNCNLGGNVQVWTGDFTEHRLAIVYFERRRKAETSIYLEGVFHLYCHLPSTLYHLFLVCSILSFLVYLHSLLECVIFYSRSLQAQGRSKVKMGAI